MTYGQIRLQLSQMFPGIALELFDGWIGQVYTEILDKLPWKRATGASIFQCPPSYAIGTVTVSQGSTAVTGSATNWTNQLNGRLFRIGNGSEFYGFTYVSATSATLDRPYEAPTASLIASGIAVDAGGTGYNVGDMVYPAGGNGLAQLQVLTIGLGGSVASLGVVVGGNNFSVATDVQTTTNGLGVGLTINITSVGTSSGLSYRIDQNVFQLPTGCRIVQQVVPLHDRDHPLVVVTPGDMNRISAWRNIYGTPRFAAVTWDADTNPPVMQLELAPVPSSPDSIGAQLSYEVTYAYDQADLNANQTQFSLLPWLRPGALIEGVSARLKRWRAKDNDLESATGHEAKFKELLASMMQVNAIQLGPQTMRMAPWLQRQTPGHYRRGPWHRGYTG